MNFNYRIKGVVAVVPWNIRFVVCPWFFCVRILTGPAVQCVRLQWCLIPMPVGLLIRTDTGEIHEYRCARQACLLPRLVVAANRHQIVLTKVLVVGRENQLDVVHFFAVVVRLDWDFQLDFRGRAFFKD